MSNRVKLLQIFLIDLKNLFGGSIMTTIIFSVDLKIKCLHKHPLLQKLFKNRAITIMSIHTEVFTQNIAHFCEKCLIAASGGEKLMSIRSYFQLQRCIFYCMYIRARTRVLLNNKNLFYYKRTRFTN